MLRNSYLLLLVLVVAALLRVLGSLHDLPFSYFGDELSLIKRAMAVGSGDLNPHWFHKPGLLIYLLTAVYGVFFVFGWLVGLFGSPSEFGALFLTDSGTFILLGRLLVASFGVATVYVVYRLTMELSGSKTTSLFAAIMLALWLPAVASSVVVKADVPSGFFLTLSFYLYLLSYNRTSLRLLLAAALMAGVATGTKYYGLVLLPVFALGELMLFVSKDAPRDSIWQLVKRWLLVGVSFIVGFFVVSPYNFLDPTWGLQMWDLVTNALGFGEQSQGYDIDREIAYERGLGGLPGATVHFFAQLVRPDVVGWLGLGLAVLGIIQQIQSKKSYGAILLVILLGGFLAMSIFLAPYHANARHFNALYPLIVVNIALGAHWLAGRIFSGGRKRLIAMATLVVAAGSVSAYSAAQHVFQLQKPNTKTAAYEWIIGNIAPDTKVLLDDYGPQLVLNGTAIDRLQVELERYPEGGAFTASQQIRLQLLEDFPSPIGYDIVRLSHQWWLPAEISDEEIRSSAVHLDMGNPLISRQPKSLAYYRDLGVDYVVTNSEAMSRYLGDTEELAPRFPSFTRFYLALEELPPIKEFRPDEGARGPSVFIYSLRSEFSEF